MFLYVILYIRVRLRKTQLGDLAQSVKQVTAMSEIQGSNSTLQFNSIQFNFIPIQHIQIHFTNKISKNNTKNKEWY